MNVDTFRDMLKDKGIDLSEKQMHQFEQYLHTLVEWNEKMNLTAITDKEEVYLKHFFDSITAAFYYDFKQDMHLCDVGAGAGFPSIPLKICFPHIKVTIVDSLQKRITFLNHLANELELTGVSFYHDRAELFGKNDKFREKFDVVTARAVARMSVLSELCLPLCKVNGNFIAMKGPNLKEELRDSTDALELLGGKVENVYTFELPEENGERNIAVIHKKRKTPKKFPRKPGVPNKTPL
ncbi:16S rRNA (guanine(527)-N(7))-methyltransferase RsmG [Aquibacillus koreensis]|uniref:Ribosomal RNA small subunit methyltransferase G n=1 Tax=Aquibacillus koreensis TaxID=279446 RepID=A0A9X3WQ08_9BACI|nr:16S rRNA (guanine(527)-N(7))-methyltransferase RsmG [Aquibacillus koreensis]MCT2535527.1 16S rRNA (guanine(527)-N(7))-methyltransferase RsmG [Aquibacillus koreensis]MDC3422758.1 16S rRNA (guanine(527)-N(7))-methyltransferase RsmG [Aquibacillus koreensis]